MYHCRDPPASRTTRELAKTLGEPRHLAEQQAELRLVA
jgi:hypothetical protein